MTREINSFDLYQYYPNSSAAIAFIILFFIIFVILGVIIFYYGQKSKKRVQSWTHVKEKGNIKHYSVAKLIGAYIPLLVGVIIECAGYITRRVSCDHINDVGPYAGQVCLLLMAPGLYAATIYMLFGRMAHLMFAEKIMLMPARFNTAFFVFGDVASFILQGAGGGTMAGDNGGGPGITITIVGLFVQIGFFGLFIINEFFFYFKVYKIDSPVVKKSKTWKLLNLNLLTNSLLILIRSIVRAIEFVEGDSGYITKHEWFLYAFDATPMFLVPVVFAITIPFNNVFILQEESVDIQLYESFNGNKNNSDDNTFSVYSEENIEMKI